MNAQRFLTLMRREWMQHRVGWLAVMLSLPLLGLLLIPLPGAIEVNGEQPPAVATAAIAMLGTATAAFLLSWVVAMFQLPGLARRDQQDRSIEFWLSLPATHSESIGAALLMHALLVPMLALLVGLLFAPVMAGAAVIKVHGISGLGSVPWAQLLTVALIAWVRASVGLVLMTLWLAPILMTLMAAAAFLKRWGVPLVIGGVIILGNVMEKIYHDRMVWDLLKQQFESAGLAFFNASQTLEGRGMPQQLEHETVGGIAQLMLHDLGAAFSQLASPHFVGGLAIAGLCFYLLVVQRSRPT
ncbi:MAG TPA: hypothetical protein VK195_14560 [Burkholderiaceae bacterium]|nr:hypothetical protein [Burkholderiaceae bacterium]